MHTVSKCPHPSAYLIADHRLWDLEELKTLRSEVVSAVLDLLEARSFVMAQPVSVGE